MTVLELRDLLDFLEIEGKGNAIVTDKYGKEVIDYRVSVDEKFLVERKECDIIKLYTNIV